MKFVNSQLSSDLLRYILPNNIIDETHYALNEREMRALYDIWKNAHQILPNRFTKTANLDQLLLVSLVNKGYIVMDGTLMAFTDSGKETVKKLVLSEKNSLKKQGE